MTLIDPEKEYSPCPWCWEPGRLIVRHFDDVHMEYDHVQVGCVNENCLVKPRTNRIVVLSRRAKGDTKKAIQKSIERWESRNDTRTKK